MNEKNWSEIEKFIMQSLNSVKAQLDLESIQAIEHYINHDEYEMAFEILFIEVMKLKSKPELDWNRSKEIALTLRLNKETIFDVNFWKNFENHIGGV